MILICNPSGCPTRDLTNLYPVLNTYPGHCNFMNKSHGRRSYIIQVVKLASRPTTSRNQIQNRPSGCGGI